MLAAVWDEFLTIIREEVGSRVVETWFKAICLHSWDEQQKVVYLHVPNAFVKSWVQKNYVPLFQMHLGRLLHVEKPQILFIGVGDAPEKKDDVDLAPSQSVSIIPARTIHTKSQLVHTDGGKRFGHINASYSFDAFVVGPSNSLAFAAAHAVMEQPGILYNPLLVYGSSGLGKTHLLHAIGNGVRMRNRRASILYQTTDRFVNEFIQAIRFNKVPKFKEKYRSVDVLLIDDVQFISNKDQTQEAFFHIFNVLHDARKQIVFSSDTFPQDLAGITERLRSRLSWGLVTDLQMPSLETKVAIVKKKASLSGVDLDDTVAHFIASYARSNIRELEGALIRVMAYGSLTKQDITLELAQRVLQRTHEAHEVVHAVNFSAIVKNVCKFYSYTVQELRSKSRNKELTQARHVAMFLMKKLTQQSLRDIGHFFGGRDHSTVMHGLQKISHDLETNSDLQQKVRLIEREIAG